VAAIDLQAYRFIGQRMLNQQIVRAAADETDRDLPARAGFSLRLGSEDITGASDGSTDCGTACGRGFDVGSRSWAGQGSAARVYVFNNLARIDSKRRRNDNGNQENQQEAKEGEEARKHQAPHTSVKSLPT
jgi:hypothetical protein